MSRVYDTVCKEVPGLGMLVREVPLLRNEFRRRFRKEPGMARSKKVPSTLVPVQAYLEGVAKQLVDRLYGPDGLPWGTKLSELEDTVIAVRQLLSEHLLAQALQRQAQSAPSRPEPFRNCSGC